MRPILGGANIPKKDRESIAAARREDALDIMLARRGKVRNCNTLGGTITLLDRGEGQHTKARWDETFEFWVYIRDELRRHGVDARLVSITGLFGDARYAAAYDVDNVKEFRYLAGRLAWLPQTEYDNDLKYIFANLH